MPVGSVVTWFRLWFPDEAGRARFEALIGDRLAAIEDEAGGRTGLNDGWRNVGPEFDAAIFAGEAIALGARARLAPMDDDDCRDWLARKARELRGWQELVGWSTAEHRG